MNATRFRSGIAWLVLGAMAAPGAASAQASPLWLCADIEARPGTRSAPSTCYAGVPCIVSVQEADADALQIQSVPGTVARLRAGTAVPRHCPRTPTSTMSLLRVETAVPGQKLVLRRPAALGVAPREHHIPLRVAPDRAFLDPRQPAASEQGRVGEGRLYTFTGRGLDSMRLRADAPVSRNGEDAARIQWRSPDGRQVRIHLAPRHAGVLSTETLFEFSGQSIPALNRDLGWPVLQVHPAH